MPEKVSRKNISINTIIGPNTSVWGDIATGGFTRVDGDIRGDMDAQGRVVVGERARMRSNIAGTAVTIGGVIQGNIFASERLTILSTGIIIGNVITRRIQAEDGCIVHGKVLVCQTDSQWETVIAEYKDAQGVQKVLSGREVKSA